MKINLYFDKKLFKNEPLFLAVRNETMKYLCEFYPTATRGFSKSNIIQIETEDEADPFYFGTTMTSQATMFFNKKLSLYVNSEMTVEVHITNKELIDYETKCININGNWKVI